MSAPLRRRGSGPGPITPDGCAVAVYTALPSTGEPEIVHAAVPAGASILELGSGAGRLTRDLVALGHPVTAVDESPEMLAHVRDAETHLGDIAVLRLGRTFDVVLLASFLVNTYREDLRAAMLATCRAHVAPGGCVLIQRHLPSYFAVSTSERYGVRISTLAVDHPEPGVVAATLEYRIGEKVWTHSFQERLLSEVELEECLAEAGLAVDAYLDRDRTWLRARAV
ncbi:methyltransferase [Actinorhabdospora filicis]|uniref:Methyltransferase n=1 Tax=Actinorhabdospora filicis TaxID=1785913 RepID=A0A9W6SL86_9ACTN|nr:class I SAM-dependent methyltransferase [Actinorhabdospora filicis]GLZ77982.1 methyltransferase [Actinorhabdospora filicis]